MSAPLHRRVELARSWQKPMELVTRTRSLGLLRNQPARIFLNATPRRGVAAPMARDIGNPLHGGSQLLKRRAEAHRESDHGICRGSYHSSPLRSLTKRSQPWQRADAREAPPRARGKL